MIQELSLRFPKHKLSIRRMLIKQSWIAGDNKLCRRRQVWKVLPPKGKEVITGLKRREETGCQHHLNSVSSAQSGLGFVHATFLFGENLEKSAYKPPLREPGLRPLIYVTMHTLCLQTASSVHPRIKKKRRP